MTEYKYEKLKTFQVRQHLYTANPLPEWCSAETLPTQVYTETLTPAWSNSGHRLCAAIKYLHYY